jgi:hypothetical protein
MKTENQKWYGLSPISIMSWGLRAPRPQRDLQGIDPLNDLPPETKKAHGFMRPMSSVPLMRSSQRDDSSDDPIPTRLHPCRAASALDRRPM